MHNFLAQIDLGKLFQPSYIFAQMPTPDGWYVYLSIIFGLFILVALLSVWLIRRQNKIYKFLQKKLFYLFLPSGIAGLLLIFFRFEQIPYLSSRLFLIILTLVFIYFGGLILFYIIFVLPKEKQAEHEKKKFTKYLPAGRQVCHNKSVRNYKKDNERKYRNG